MVLDNLAHAGRYESLGARFRDALAFLERSDLATLAAGTYELDGRRLYALVQDYQTKRRADGRWEAHRQYIDLQFVVAGRERFGCGPAGRMTEGAYDEERDMERPDVEGSFVDVQAGDFLILWPGEPHMPGMAVDDEPSAVRKVVIKIAAD